MTVISKISIISKYRCYINIEEKKKKSKNKFSISTVWVLFESCDLNEDIVKRNGLIKIILMIITIYYSDTTTKFQLFDFLVYTVWACLKAMTL